MLFAAARAAALAPVAVKTPFYARVGGKLMRTAGVPNDRLVTTNLGLRSDLRCAIPAHKTHYLFGRPDTDLAERAPLRIAARLGRECPHFIDAGANEGIYTFLAGGLSPRPELHWFEPDDELFERTARNLGANGVAAMANRAAVAAQSGTATFFKNLSDDASGSLTGFFAGKHDTAAQAVQTVALADYFEAHGVENAFLKIDVEGAGAAAWAGAARAADRVRYLLIEILAPEFESGLPRRLIEDHGLRGYYICGFDLIESAAGEFDYREPHWNWLFCRLAPADLSARLGAPFTVTPAQTTDG